ncbi:MAG: EamA family transporter RarD [Thermomicrobiales bacterium]|nr:EamA family transporter RarD [Thermomicrobiales bacterium]
MKRGILASVLASTMFGAIYYIVTLMHPLTAQQIFSWRMTLTGPLVTVLVVAVGDWPKVRDAIRDIGRRPGVLIVHIFNAANNAAQMWVFMWAPLHGKAMEASLGYFLMPLVMVLFGRVLYRESMSRWQIAATAMAAIGVLHEVWRVGTVSWLVMFIAIGFPLLFVSRRQFRTTGQGGAWIELNLIFLLAVTMLIRSDFTREIMSPRLAGWIITLGLISATSMLIYYAASRWLPFSLFGLLGYLEPVLLVFVALILGETLGRDEWLTYIPIWIAVSLLVIEGARNLHRSRTAP